MEMLLFMLLQVLSNLIPEKRVQSISDPSQALQEALAIKIEIFKKLEERTDFLGQFYGLVEDLAYDSEPNYNDMKKLMLIEMNKGHSQEFPC